MFNALRRPAVRRALRHSASARSASLPTLAAALLGAACLSAGAQDVTPPTAFERQLHHVSFAINGSGEFTSTSTGTNSPLQQTLTTTPSNTFGALVTLRYSPRPFVGLEANYGYARYTENFVTTDNSSSVANAQQLNLGIQTNVTEYSFGYVVRTPQPHYGVTPFASVGAGTLAFRPTPGGGQGLLTQARAAYYYDVGVDAPLFGIPDGAHFGLRVQFRQAFFLHPDYETNYLRDLKRTSTLEPAVGFYYHF